MSAILRPYQARALDLAREHFRRGARRVLLVAPTGAGKTVIFSAIARAHAERGGRVLVFVHRDELLTQSVEKLRAEGLHVGEIAAGRPRDPGAPVQVASIGTVLAMHKRGEALPGASLVVLDEAHHYVADTWGAIAASYVDAKIVGVTATPERGDGTPLGDLFDVLVPVASVRELTELGYLVPCEVRAPKRKRRTLSQDPVDAYREHATGRRAVVFAASVAASQDLAARFVAAGIAAAHIDGTTPVAERRDTLTRFERGELSVLTNVFVLTEGWDCPPVDTCILARGFTHAGTYLQAVGRVLRPSPGKTRAIVLDLRGAAVTHGLPDAERVYSLEGRGIGLAPTKECIECGADVPLAAPECPECGHVFPPGLGAELGAMEPEEALRTLTQETIERAYWAEMVATAAARGFRPGWAVHRFAERFGRRPWKLWRETYGRNAA